MPEGDLEKVTAEYKEMAFDKIKQFTKVQFLHWTEEEFSIILSNISCLLL